jgi:hypothetical protein
MVFPTDFRPDNNKVVHELSGSYMWIEEGVVYIYPKAGIGHNISRAKEQTSIFQEKIVEQDKQYALICDIRHSDPIGKECRDYYVSDTATRNVSSFSFLVDSKFSMVMANFFIGLSSLKIQVKMFTSSASAISWSKDHIVLL